MTQSLKAKTLFIKTIISAIAVAAISGCSQPKAPDFEKTVNAQILNHYQNLASRTEEFTQAASACKANPTLDTIQSLKTDWKKTMTAWQDIQWVSFGPISESNRQWQMEFWPDQKNIIGRKMNTLLNLDEVSAEDLKKSGTVVQGLSALEYLIFDPSVETNNPVKSCQLIQLISQSMKTTTSDMAAGWTDFGQKQIAQSQKQVEEGVETATEFTTELVSSMVNHFTMLVVKKLENPLALSMSNNDKASHKKSRPNPYFLESWRSDISYSNVLHNYASIKAFLIEGGFIQHLRDKGHADTASKIEKQLAAIDTIANDTPAFSLELIQNQKWDQKRSEDLFIGLHNLSQLISQNAVKDLGIMMSFNASDGDF